MKASVISMVFTFVNIGISRCHVLLRTFGLQAIERYADWRACAVYLSLTRYCVQAFICDFDLIPGRKVSATADSCTC